MIDENEEEFKCAKEKLLQVIHIQQMLGEITQEAILACDPWSGVGSNCMEKLTTATHMLAATTELEKRALNDLTKMSECVAKKMNKNHGH